jgi:ribosomal protein S18 acetylase RimI-like enzyme
MPSAARSHELLPALRLLLGDRAESCRDALASGTQDPLGVFVTRDTRGRVCGAVMVQAMPGALGVAWPPRGCSPETEDALTAAACDWLRARGVKVCQAIVPAAEFPATAPLERAGFRHVTQLVFLRRELDPSRDRLPPEERPAGVHYHPDFRDRFAAALLGFGLPGEASAWHFLALGGGEPTGLWMTEPGEAGAVVLTYLGVVPAARGRGLGERLLRHVLHEAACGGFAAVELSVDARNEPALHLYRRHGFAATGRREVLIAHLGS